MYTLQWGAADRLPPTLPLPQPTSPPTAAFLAATRRGTCPAPAPDGRPPGSHGRQDPRVTYGPAQSGQQTYRGRRGGHQAAGAPSARAHPTPPATRRDGFPDTHCPPQASAFPHSSPPPPAPPRGSWASFPPSHPHVTDAPTRLGGGVTLVRARNGGSLEPTSMSRTHINQSFQLP